MNGDTGTVRPHGSATKQPRERGAQPPARLQTNEDKTAVAQGSDHRPRGGAQQPTSRRGGKAGQRPQGSHNAPSFVFKKSERDMPPPNGKKEQFNDNSNMVRPANEQSPNLVQEGTNIQAVGVHNRSQNRAHAPKPKPMKDSSKQKNDTARSERSAKTTKRQEKESDNAALDWGDRVETNEGHELDFESEILDFSSESGSQHSHVPTPETELRRPSFPGAATTPATGTTKSKTAAVGKGRGRRPQSGSPAIVGGKMTCSQEVAQKQQTTRPTEEEYDLKGRGEKFHGLVITNSSYNNKAGGGARGASALSGRRKQGDGPKYDRRALQQDDSRSGNRASTDERGGGRASTDERFQEKRKPDQSGKSPLLKCHIEILR